MVRFIAQLLAYLVGSIPFGYLVAKAAAGIDIRKHGSGNIGATNVARVLGLRYFFVVFLLDFLKGLVPVLVAIYLQRRHIGLPSEPEYLYLPEVVGFATILGHLFPIYLNLRGGKGVATSLGVILVLAPYAFAAGLVAWTIFFLLSRMVSVGSIAFAAVFAGSYFLGGDDPFAHKNLGLTVFVALVSLLVIARHWSNIGRIVNGTEPQAPLPWTRNG